ncbi:TniQ family protein [Pseudoalteromonas sp. bablab_jr004]|uniref:TniQ family protein n=1 Tax=Pseudoalteromonas sp. bablab_jr004 TaxID=2755065 RepID=UPI0018F78ACF|nr:TniQ family protein [Pseudoalteromonas sp. bablab_jr004]
MRTTLPVHPQPIPGELFSSWVYRAARANGQNVTSFCHLLLPELKKRYYDLDSAVNKEALLKLCQLLRTPYQRAWETTLDSYAGLLYASVTPKANRKACVLHTGIAENIFKRFSLQYCPLCLGEKVSYYRKVWRVSFITVCTKHGCKLHDRCPKCHYPIRPLFNDVSQPRKMPFLGTITQCFYCGFELCDTTVEMAIQSVVTDTVFYESVLKAGFCRLDTSVNWVYSFSLFCVLRHLIYLLRPKHCRQKSPDVMSLKDRYFAMRRLGGAFGNWPGRLIELHHKAGIKYYHWTNMTKNKHPIPYWLDSAIRPKIYIPKTGPTRESVYSAIEYMREKKRRISLLQVNKLLGYQDSGLVKKFYKEIIE